MTERLERRLGELFFGPARKPRPCKTYRAQRYADNGNRYFRDHAEAIDYAKTAAAKTNDTVHIMRRCRFGRGRCPNCWESGSDVLPDGSVWRYGKHLT